MRLAIVGLLVFVTLAPAQVPTTQTASSLSEAYEGRFAIGAALATSQVRPPQADLLRLVAREFSSITPETAMKWRRVQPAAGRFDFRDADAVLGFAEANGHQLIGHTLVWHTSTPDWVFKDSQGQQVAPGVLRQRLREHIATVVGRYRGRVAGWDVVNEAFLDDGTLRPTRWLEILGQDYLAEAFRAAQEADPDTALYYNDYGMTRPAKREAVRRMVQRLRGQGIRVDGVGLQGHWRRHWPTLEAIDAALTDYAQLGLRVAISELDIDILPRPVDSQGNEIYGADITKQIAGDEALDPYRNGLPPEVARQQAEHYAALFKLFEKHADTISRVTFWGVHDGQSWLNNWPIKGRTSHSLLFDRQLQPKAAYKAIVEK